MNLLKHTQGEFLTHPQLPEKSPSSPGLESVFPNTHSPPYVHVVMVTVQGWANVQQQFDRLVHFEYKPTSKQNTLLQIWSVQ